MLSWRVYSGVVPDSLGIVAIILLVLSRNQPTGEERRYFLPARIVGSLAVIALAASSILPPLFSPRVTVQGPVTGFHQVDGFRTSHFEFSITTQPEPRTSIRAHYFDKGFYFGDPAVSNGDVVKVSWLAWNSDATEIKEVAGRHPGWTHIAKEQNPGPWMLGAIGVFILAGGISAWLADRAAQARPQ